MERHEFRKAEDLFQLWSKGNVMTEEVRWDIPGFEAGGRGPQANECGWPLGAGNAGNNIA